MCDFVCVCVWSRVITCDSPSVYRAEVRVICRDVAEVCLYSSGLVVSIGKASYELVCSGSHGQGGGLVIGWTVGFFTLNNVMLFYCEAFSLRGRRSTMQCAPCVTAVQCTVNTIYNTVNIIHCTLNIV